MNSSNIQTTGDIMTLVTRILGDFHMVVVGISIVAGGLFFALGAFQRMTSSDPHTVQQGTDKMKNAVIMVILINLAYPLIRLIASYVGS